MAKKNTKKTAPKKVSKKTSSKSHGELFDKHPNLLWLLPIFFLIAAIAVYMINNMYSVPAQTTQQVVEEKMMNNPDVNIDKDVINKNPITNENLQ